MKKNLKKKKNKRGKIAKEILMRILNSAESLSQEFEDMRHFSSYISGTSGLVAEIERAKERKYFQEELARLKRQKFIKERKTGKQLELCLTNKGRKAVLRHQILKNKKLVKDKYYIVIFDIPESERNIRDFFRYFLKEADFIQLQQSVWLTQKDIAKQVKELICLAGAEKWIHLITATEISNFNIKDKKRGEKIDRKIKKTTKYIKIRRGGTRKYKRI